MRSEGQLMEGYTRNDGMWYLRRPRVKQTTPRHRAETRSLDLSRFACEDSERVSEARWRQVDTQTDPTAAHAWSCCRTEKPSVLTPRRDVSLAAGGNFEPRVERRYEPPARCFQSRRLITKSCSRERGNIGNNARWTASGRL